MCSQLQASLSHRWWPTRPALLAHTAGHKVLLPDREDCQGSGASLLCDVAHGITRSLVLVADGLLFSTPSTVWSTLVYVPPGEWY
jgi:hypothetical protein